MPVTPELLDTYRNAEYVVFADPPVVIRVGEANPQVDELIRAEGARTAAFVTAANPRGEPRSDMENGVANAALQNFVSAAGYPHFWGEGRDPRGNWAEPSFPSSVCTARMPRRSASSSSRTRSSFASWASRPSSSSWRKTLDPRHRGHYRQAGQAFRDPAAFPGERPERPQGKRLHRVRGGRRCRARARLPDEMGSRDVPRHRKMGKHGCAQGARGGAPHGGLRREDEGADREPRHP